VEKGDSVKPVRVTKLTPQFQGEKRRKGKTGGVGDRPRRKGKIFERHLHLRKNIKKKKKSPHKKRTTATEAKRVLWSLVGIYNCILGGVS